MIETIITAISAFSAAVAAYFAYRAIRENKKNIFLLERHRVALAARKLKLDFDTEWLAYKISEHLEHQGTLLSSQYFINPSLFEKFTSVLVKLHQLESKQRMNEATEEMARGIADDLNNITCDIRLDH